MTGFVERYDAEPRSVSRARERVARIAVAAGAGEPRLADIRLAVSEAMTNAVVHGYRGAPGDVRVSVTVDARGLLVSVRDGGAGLSPPAQRPGMGVGLGLIAEVADEMAVAPMPGGGTVLRMRFDLGGQPELAAAA